MGVSQIPKEIDIEMTLKARVRITEEIKNGMKEQYPYTEEELANDELVAKQILYAWLNPKLIDWEVKNKTSDEIWDGVGNFRSLIRDVELENE